MSMMDFDLSKENIQPLRGGRNASQLGVALEAQNNLEHQRELMQQREEFENLIKNYNGTDPLANWYNYISWVEQSYPKHGHEGNLVALLEQVLGKFENDKQYTDDRRFCKLWIKYIDLQQNPVELYHMMHARGLCRGCADLYRAWAYYHEAAGDFQSANHVFECGKNALAQPYEELENAHKNLIMAVGQHTLYGTDERRLLEKRQALTSLHTYKPGRVSSIRIGTVPGIVPAIATSSRCTNNNNIGGIAVYKDRGDEVKGAEAAPVSILTAAKRQDIPKENTLKPGPWTTVPVKKRFTVQHSVPGFIVHEDDDDNNSDIEIGSLNKSLHFPKTTLETYSNWHVSLIIDEPKDDRMVSMYPKAQVYSESNTEYCLEELRARVYFSKRNLPLNISNSFNEAPNSSINKSIIKPQSNNCEEIGNFPFREQDQQQQQQQQQQQFSGAQPLLFQQQSFNQSQNQRSVQETIQKSPPYHHHHLTQQEASETLLKLHQSPVPAVWISELQQSRTVEVDNDLNKFHVWNSPEQTDSMRVMVTSPKISSTSKFTIYEQSNIGLEEQIEPKVKRFCPNPGSAMKTPFKTLNADDLAETGSRGGMDIGAAAQPVDSAKRLSIFDDDSSSSLEEIQEKAVTFEDLTCNTQMFNFNLNSMQVSTPQNKQQQIEPFMIYNDDCMKINNTRKQLFTDDNNKQTEFEKAEKALSTILEETKSYGSSSSSSGATTKSSLFNNHTKQNNMATISEEHNSYLAQNLMANAALRSSLLGDIMDFDTQKSSPINTMQSSPICSLPNSPTRKIPITPLEYIPSDPFKPSILNTLLQKVSFPGPYTRGYYIVNSIPRIVVRKETVTIGSDKYVIEKQLGKGTFGTVFRGLDLKTNNTVALKFQKPANKWEFYICRELQNRLADHPLRDRFMDVRIGYFSDQASILISEFMPCGSLLNVANVVKQKSGRSMKESLCIYFCLNMLKVVQTMHDVKIIHADIKPDNFLVQVMPDGTVGLQLIDFGCSIDMTLFPTGASFTRRITTEDFVCCEMKDGRPWNYHTDLFCIAATAHVLLFEKYIQLRKKDGLWSISHRLPRYLRLDLWNMFFSSLLNQQNGPADSLSLQTMLDESLKHRADDYHLDMRYLINILRNR